jgi:hypothetical protein
LPILPIDTGRYGTAEMKKVSEEDWEKKIKANIGKSVGKTKYRDIQFAK